MWVLVASAGSIVGLRSIVPPMVIEASVVGRVILVTGISSTVTVALAVRPLAVFAVISAVPALTPVTTPSETVATVSSEELQVTFLLVASAGSTVGVRVIVLPTLIVSLLWSSVMAVGSMVVTSPMVTLVPSHEPETT